MRADSVSVGRMAPLLYDGPTCKVIVPHVSTATNEGCGDIPIPAVAVVRMADIDIPN
jgi:hypothetical protein